MRSSTARAAGCLVLAVLLLLGLAGGAFWWLRSRGVAPPVPGEQRCVATAGGHAVVLDLDQARYASIIAGLSVKRGLAPRAASIALATAYQESDIRNLDYGDRDSVGLFQQRPSQGWGTEEQLMDPYYATNKFYDALVKVKGWKTGDINDVAQRVQRSGYPEAYRDHETDARVLASTLTGESPNGFTCLEREGTAGKPRQLLRSIRKTFGPVKSERSPTTITIRAESSTLAWAYAHYAVANSKTYGVTEVVVGERRWQTDAIVLPEWTTGAEPLGKTEIRITLR